MELSTSVAVVGVAAAAPRRYHSGYFCWCPALPSARRRRRCRSLSEKVLAQTSPHAPRCFSVFPFFVRSFFRASLLASSPPRPRPPSGTATSTESGHCTMKANVARGFVENASVKLPRIYSCFIFPTTSRFPSQGIPSRPRPLFFSPLVLCSSPRPSTVLRPDARPLFVSVPPFSSQFDSVESKPRRPRVPPDSSRPWTRRVRLVHPVGNLRVSKQNYQKRLALTVAIKR